MTSQAENEEFVTYSEFRGFVTETRTGFAHIESKIDWLQNTMNIRFEAMDKRFDDFTANIDKRFEAMDKRFDDANIKSHREFVGIMLGFLSINLVIIGSVIGLIAKTG